MTRFVLLLILVGGCSARDETGSILVHRKYFPSGRLMELRHFRNGAKEGLQTGFWENGRKRFEYSAKNDACEGELREWSEDGQLFHLAHYKNGLEDGLQQMWHPNGELRSNFVLIKGRRFGLLGTKKCITTDEAFITD